MPASQSLHILLVDDEPALINVLEPLLKSAGHRVTSVATGGDAIAIAGNPDIDVMLLDLGLSDMDGKQVIAEIRSWFAVPILVISARHQEQEKISALDAGADDYVNKPFVIGELLARIRAAVRRHEGLAGPSARFVSRDLQVDFGARKVLLLGEEIKLAPKEFDLLRLLVQHAGQVVTHKRLLSAGWSGSTSDTQYLRTYMGLLRQKLEEDPSEPRLILTEPGVGYRLNVAE